MLRVCQCFLRECLLLLVVALFQALGATKDYGELLQWGNELKQRGDTKGASDAYKQAVRINPAAFYGYMARGSLYCELNKIVKCKKMFKKGLEVCPTEVRSMMKQNIDLELGQALYRTSDLDKALKHLQKAASADNDRIVATALYTQGQTLESKAARAGGGWVQNEYAKEAKEKYLETIATPAFANASLSVKQDCYTNLGIMYRRMESPDHLAEEALRNALEINPKHAGALSHLMEMMIWRGDQDKADELMARSISYGLWEHPQQFPQEYTQGVKAEPWPDISQYSSVLAVVQQLEAGYSQILEEMRPLLSQTGFGSLNFGVMEHLSPSDGKPYGGWHSSAVKCDKAPERTPNTCSVLRKISGDLFTAQFLRLQPGANILPHCGFGNHRWVVHLGLDIPDKVFITVAGETRKWVQGKCIVFDDSFLHSVKHEGDRDRIVLAVQIPNPEFERTTKSQRDARKSTDEL